jgi:hypothetical protein
MPTKQFGVDFAPATTPLDGTETLSIVQGGVTVDSTTQDIADLASGGVTSVNGLTGVVVLDLDDINDVDAAAPTDGQVLTWVAADNEWQAVTPSGGVSDGDKGDITVSSGGTVWTVDAGVITYAKMQNISATQRILGRNTAGAGSTEEVTFTQFLDWVGSPANGDILYRAAGVWTRLPVSTDGFVLTLASGLPTWAAGGGGSLTGFTASLETASPNNTVNASRLLASGGTTNQDFVAQAKGSGAFQMQLADNTTTGGNKRGANAADLQSDRNGASQVASGASSFVVGRRNTASSTYSCAIGDTNVASGTASNATGGMNTASGPYSHSQGIYADTRSLEAVRAWGSGRFAATGDAQKMEAVLRLSTANATPAVLTHAGGTGGTTTPSATNQLVLPNNSCYGIRAIVVVRENATGDTAMYDVAFCIKRGANAAATALVGTPTVAQTWADAGAITWTIGVTANTTLGCPTITATGEAAHTLRWGMDVYACIQISG